MLCVVIVCCWGDAERFRERARAAALLYSRDFFVWVLYAARMDACSSNVRWSRPDMEILSPRFFSCYIHCISFSNRRRSADEFLDRISLPFGLCGRLLLPHDTVSALNPHDSHLIQPIYTYNPSRWEKKKKTKMLRWISIISYMPKEIIPNFVISREKKKITISV